MDPQTLLGVFLVFAGMASILTITLRSRRIINRIARRKAGTVREIIKDMQDSDVR